MIKINFVDMYKEFDKEKNYFSDVIKKNFGGFVISDTPDFLFYSCSGTEHYKYKNCVKIFYTGEPVTPDFNECDYAIGFDEIDFGGRYCKRPYWFGCQSPQITTKTDEELLDREFCNFIYSNETRGTAVELRKMFCKKLMEYKHVDCPGKVLNNMQNAISPREKNARKGKLDFVQHYKFTIAFENCKMNGYTTEKLEDPLSVQSVPIYWGNPNVNKDFNEDAFVFCNGYEENFEKIIERIIFLDTHDEEYLRMVRTPCMSQNYNVEDEKQKLENFVVNIISKGNVPFEKDPLGYAKIMTIPELSGKELVKKLASKVSKRIK